MVEHLSAGERARLRRQVAQRAGHAGERLAALRLQLTGYRILARRFRTKVGEIDLIVRRGRVVAFVEVKRRVQAVAAAEAVTPATRRRIRRAAELFLQRNEALAGL